MRAAKIAFLLLVLSAANFAQQSSTTPTAITGCLMNLNGAFTLLTPNGDRFILKGRQNTLFSHNGQQVQVTGTPKSTIKGSSAPKPGDFHFTSIRTLSNVCR